MDEYSDAKSAALKRAADIVLKNVQRQSPGSGQIRESWRLINYGDKITVRSANLPAEMTELNKRHPVFARGPRKDWGWAAENEKHPERTGWAERAVLKAADAAERAFADGYLDRIAIDSPIFDRR